MAKSTKRTRKVQQKDVEKRVDKSVRALQFVALIVLVILILIDAFLKDYELPVWVLGGIVGIAVGLSPDQMFKLIKDIALAFMGKRK